MRFPLCVLTPELGILNETFIAWDVNELLPGRTVVVADPPPGGQSNIGTPAWTTDAPTLTFGPVEGDPPPDAERRRALSAFLVAHGVEVVLVQFLDFAERWIDTLLEIGVRVWIRAHGADASARPSESYRRFNSAAGVMVPSQAIAGQLAAVGVSERSIHLVPNHVSVPAKPPRRRPDSADIRCLSVGRMVEKKGHGYLIEAFRHAVSVEPRLRLEIVGDGPLRPDMELAIAGIANRVTLGGSLPPARVAEKLAGADIYAHHAVTGSDGDTEGQPLTILEAMAAGLPLVLSRHAGLAEITGDSECALFSDEADVDETANALLTLARDIDLRRSLGARSWQRARDGFSHEHVRPQLLALFGINGGHR